MKLLSALLLITLTSAAPALAQQDVEKDTKKVKLICRDLGSTGSRAKSNRVCRTKEQWDEIKAESQATAEDWKEGIKRDQAANPR